ncbi:MAG TPA: exodeoxyribonuclease V subunit gamma [Anaerolineales bacterium]|nr:exodeoxyribonuclease V subunit gamma [Anaerolineales bacterium]
MTISLIVSLPASGKTQRCIQRVQAQLKIAPFSNTWMILPDRRQATAFRRRLAKAKGGALGAQVGTFGSLYEYFLEKAGQPIPLASGPIIHRLLQEAVRRVKPQLQFYQAIAEMPGFILELSQRFGELKRALVYPEQFAEAAASNVALREISLIYTAYQGILRGQGWADQEGMSWLAVQALEAQPELASGLDLLVVDGFEAFEGGQLSTLRLLADAGVEMLVTLPGAPDMQRQAHRRFQRGLQDLQEICGDSLCISKDEFSIHLPSLLTHIEKQIFDRKPSAETLKDDHSLEMRACRTPVEEAREALRWIKARIVRDGLAANACAIFAPMLDAYAPHLRSAAREFGLSLHFYHGQSLATAPVIGAILNLLVLPIHNFHRGLLLDTLRSPYLDMARFQLTSRDIHTLELVSLDRKIIVGREQWEEALDWLANQDAKPTEDPDDEFHSPTLPRGPQAASLKTHLFEFLDLLQVSLDVPQRLETWVAWLEERLEALGFYDKTRSAGEQEPLNTFGEILRAMIVGETIVEGEAVTYPEFLGNLQGAVGSASYREELASSYGSVQVGHLMDCRGLRFRAVAILGLAEGMLPEQERVDPWLDEDLRCRLKLEQRLQREQAGLFYQAVTRCDDYLLLTRPYLADNGEPWLESPYWKEVSDFFPHKQFPDLVQTIQPEAPRPLANAASAEEALLWTMRHNTDLPDVFENELLARWEYLGHARSVLAARSNHRPMGVFDGGLDALAEQLSALYDSKHIWSPTALETYGTCPFRFYVERLLGLEAQPIPEPGLTIAQRGSLLHAILEHVYQQADNPADVGDVLAHLPDVAQEQFRKKEESREFRPSALWETEKAQMVTVLENTIRELDALQPGWKPIAYELKFGKDDISPLKIALEQSGEIQVRGVIDRLDQDVTGTRTRVVDYKTGSSHLDKNALLSGRRLQLPLYALAAQQVHQYPFPIEGLYWAILSAKPGKLTLSSFEHEDLYGPQGALEAVKARLDQIVAGIRAGEFPPIPPDGGCPSYCAAAAWCWRYEPEGRYD